MSCRSATYLSASRSSQIPRWPAMWRARSGERLSDMVNLTRAKDAAIAWARPRGLSGTETVTWHRREIVQVTPLTHEMAVPAPRGELPPSCLAPTPNLFLQRERPVLARHAGFVVQ